MTDMNGFNNVLTQCFDACEKVNFSGSDWMPPDSTYVCLLEDAQQGMKTNDEGVNCVWLRMKFKVTEANGDAEIEGRSFTRFIFIDPSKKWSISKKDGSKYPNFKLQELLFAGSCCAGIAEVKDPSSAAAAIMDSIGEFLSIRIKRSKGGFPNVFYNEKLAAAV